MGGEWQLRVAPKRLDSTRTCHFRVVAQLPDLPLSARQQRLCVFRDTPYYIFVALRVLHCDKKQLGYQKSRSALRTSASRTMTEVIRDEEVRRRIRLAQEFLDPGIHGLRFGEAQILTMIR